MIKCPNCGNDNLPGAQYCDQCGFKILSEPPVSAGGQSVGTNYSHSNAEGSDQTGIQDINVTSVELQPLVESEGTPASPLADAAGTAAFPGKHARLVIERGDSAETEFVLTGEESNIGRWDADNGIFPDIDLDAHDPDAKVSRRHARIIHRNGKYILEDLGSTNGTFINRGRRLLPGTPQELNEGDEIIVGKTFLRFYKSGDK